MSFSVCLCLLTARKAAIIMTTKTTRTAGITPPMMAVLEHLGNEK